MKYIYLIFGFCLIIGNERIYAQCQGIVQPTQLVVKDIGTNDPALWNPAGILDDRTDLSNLAEAPVTLSFVTKGTCGYPVTCSIYLDVDNNGYAESSLNSASFLTYPAGTFPYFGLNNYLTFDGRQVSAGDKFRFALKTEQVADSTFYQVVWVSDNQPDLYQPLQLPYGRHSIVWNIGPEYYTQGIDIEDGAAPVVSCKAFQSYYLMNTIPSLAYVWADDLIDSVSDNYTLSSQILFGIREKGLGFGFPVLQDGTPQTFITYNCCELGAFIYELWVKDLYDNTSICVGTVLIQDNIGSCGPGNLFVQQQGCCTLTEFDDLVCNVNIAVHNPVISPDDWITMTNANGCAEISLLDCWSVPISPDFKVTPTLTDDPANGVTTWDIVLISRHILGNQPLGSPYRMIAADVNHSGTITNFDVVEIRKLILGIYDKFPQSDSWRFVRRKQVFTQPANPFLDTLQESMTIDDFNAPDIPIFTAIKMGDVNVSATTTLKNLPDDRDIGGCWIFSNSNNKENGIPVFLDISKATLGAQSRFKLKYTGRIRIEPNRLIRGLSDDNFFLDQDGNLTISWNTDQPQTLASTVPVFWLIPEDGEVEQFSLDETFVSEYYTDIAGIPGRFRLGMAAEFTLSVSVNMYPPQPNPTTAGFEILLKSGQAETGHFILSDNMGRMVVQKDVQILPGWQSIKVQASEMTNAGMYFWTLTTTNSQEFSGKIIRL